MTAAGPLSHTPQSQFAARGGAGRLAFGRPALPWLGFSVSEFKLAPGGARAPALQVWRGGACRWLGGAEATWRHLPTHQAQVAHVLQPSTCGEGGGAGGLEGPKPPGATCPGPGGARAPALQVWRGGACRWLRGAEATWSHLPGPRWRTCSSPPGRCGEGGQVAWRGAKPPGATRAVTWPQAAFGIYSRCFLHCLPMATGGVSHLLQVLFALFCPCPQAA